jgi:hypothetical protein
MLQLIRAPLLDSKFANPARRDHDADHVLKKERPENFAAGLEISA